MRFSSRLYDLKRLRLIAEEAQGDRVLDIGHAQLPNPYLDGARCIGLDLRQAEQCDYAEQIVGDVREISSLVGGRRFDTIIAAEFIEHVEDPYAVLRCFREVLASGGRLILSTPNPVAFPTLLLEWVVSRRFFYTTEHTYYFAPRWMIRVLEGSGFKMKRVRPVGFWPVGWLPASVGLSYQVIYVATPSDDIARGMSRAAVGESVE